jgi:hypothetical protein
MKASHSEITFNNNIIIINIAQKKYYKYIIK